MDNRNDTGRAPGAAAESPPQWIHALLDPRCYPHRAAEPQLVETHISWVVLTGAYAYKIKKPVKLAFLDFSTLELRHRFCIEELRLNKRLARDLYIDVVPIGGSYEEPRVGTGPAIEYAIKMRQFDTGSRLDSEIARGAVDADDIRQFAIDIAEFHASQAPITRLAGSQADAIQNVRELRELPEADGCAGALEELERWTAAEKHALEPIFAQRIAGGHYRDCHGDLHLENVVVDGGKLVAFDALEFDASRRIIDTMDETAFFMMDLMAHERSDLAFVYLSQYLENTGDYEGLRTLRFYMAFRALVRAKVCAIKDAGQMLSDALTTLGRYVELARKLSAPGKGLLLITHGLSGSGKTYLTNQLIGPMHAVRIRSDLERKRLLALPALARTDSPVGGGLYSTEISARVYDQLLGAARVALDAGFNCIVDAAFLRRGQRRPFIDLARQLGAETVVLDCATPEAVLRERITRREAGRKDASEAGIAVLDYQLQQRQPLTAEESELAEPVDTTAEIDAAALAKRISARAPMHAG